MNRPFYTTFAWAYDLLLHAPVVSRTAFIEAQLRQKGVASPATLLDAGCGTGSYSIALAGRGFSVWGLDVSAELLAEARTKSLGFPGQITFLQGDILDIRAGVLFDAVLCRGVLNDLVDEPARQRVFSSFANALRPSGVLIFDVRNWATTEPRKQKDPVFEKTVMTDRGVLTFRSVTRLEPNSRSLFVSERHTLANGANTTDAQFDCVMKCWTQEELDSHLSSAGFRSIRYYGDYDDRVAVESTDRIVAVATLKE